MKLNILLLCDKPNVGNDANTIVDHIEAIQNYSTHKIWLCSNRGNIPNQLDLQKFDIIIVHYSLCILNNCYIAKNSKDRIRNFKGLKVAFVQDEYRQINKMNEELKYLGIDVMFTCFPESEMHKIYSNTASSGMSLHTNLTGYIPERLIKEREHVPISARTLDVGYRGRKLSYWYGELTYEKWNIVDKWFEHVGKEQLLVDLSYDEKDRIYGSDWVNFLQSCKTTLGVESGASVMDFTGELEKTVELHQLQYPQATFYDVQKKYLMEDEGKYKLNQISPRCFEAIALKTVLVLYEGEYSGILVPDRHYIMLKKDFSNIQDVLLRIKDNVYLQNMADYAFEEIALNSIYSYKSFIATVDEILTREFSERKKVPVKASYNLSKYNRMIKKLNVKNQSRRNIAALFQKTPLWFRLLARAIVRPQLAFRPKYIFLTIKKYYIDKI